MKNNKIILIITIILLMTLILGTTYAYLQMTTNSNQVSGSAGCYNVSYNGVVGRYNSTEVTIESSDTYEPPYENDTGYATVTLKKAADCQIYTNFNIKIKTENIVTSPTTDQNYTSRNLLLEGALKYTVIDPTNNTRWNGTITNTDTTLTTFETTLASGIPLTDSDKVYKIYIWVDSGITSESQISYDGLKYSGKIFVDAYQQSTINN